MDSGLLIQLNSTEERKIKKLDCTFTDINRCQNQYWMRNATKGYIQDTTLYTFKWKINAVRIKICKEKYKNMHGNTTHAYKRQIITTWGVKGRIYRWE